VPFIAFAAVLARHTATDQTRGFARDVTAVARALSLAMDNQAVLYRTALEALGRSPAGTWRPSTLKCRPPPPC